MNAGGDWINRFKDDPRRSGIFLDFDGTIIDIAPTPAGARLHPHAAELLAGLSRRYPMCVLSGRRVADVASLVGLPHIHYVGVHGMEWMDDEPHVDPEVLPYLPTLDRARNEMLAFLPDLPGVELEDKMVSLSLHYREATQEAEGAEVMAQGLADRLALKLYRGRKTVELRPPVDIDKGTVIIRLAAGWKLRRAFYAGDDITDVDAFRGLRYLMKDRDFEGVAVAVLSPEIPIELEAVADLAVEGPEGLFSLLSQLL